MPDKSQDMERTGFASPVVQAQPTGGGVIGNGIYESVKARRVARELCSGKRISVEPLADQLFVSNTPVREALIRLAAERVIKDVPKAGFFIKDISESEMRDLYTLQHLLLDWCLSVIRNDGRVPGLLKPPDLCDELDRPELISPQKAVDVMDRLFIHISRQSGNADVVHMVGNINDRTHYVRKKQHEALGNTDHMLHGLCRTYHQKDFGKLREDLNAYFRDRIEGLRDLLRFLT